MNTEVAIEMGKKVAKTILKKDSLIELEKEFEYLQQLPENKKMEGLENCPNLQKIIKTILPKYKKIKMSELLNFSEKEDGELLKYLGKEVDLGEVKRFAELFRFLEQRKYLNFLGISIFYFFFVKRNKGKKVCEFCSKNEENIDDFSCFKVSNKTNYVSDYQRAKVCRFCSFYTYLSNYYPHVNYTQVSKIKYHCITNDSNLIELVWLYEKDITRFLKDQYIKQKLFNKLENNYLVFYKKGSQSENNTIVAYGKLNITDTLIKILEKESGDKIISKFKTTFFEGPIMKNLPVTFRYFCNFIQNDYMPIELEKAYLALYREKREEYLKNFLDFEEFLNAYLEVKRMENTENEVETRRISPLLKGYMLGKEIKDQWNEEGLDEKAKEQERKWIISLSGSMELSPTTFQKGILEILRRIRQTNILTKDLDLVANDEKARVEFLIALLAEIEKKDYARGGEIDVKTKEQ